MPSRVTSTRRTPIIDDARLWLDGSGGIVSSSANGVIGGSEDWTEVTGCATAPAGADSARFRLHAPVEPDNAGTVWFDDLDCSIRRSRRRAPRRAPAPKCL